MKKYVILSVNDNPKYLFYVPLVAWGWKRIGWEPVLFFTGTNMDLLMDEPYRQAIHYRNIATNEMASNWVHLLKAIPGYKSETIAQVSRLFGDCVVPSDSYLMTSDIDMLPLSDYWNPKPHQVTVYGRDLTDYHYPICYIGMPDYRWEEVMEISSRDYNVQIKNNLRHQENMWILDQDLITEKIKGSGLTISRIDRGTDKRTGYPLGRVDRSNWRLDHDVLIDAHLPHDILTSEASFKKVLDLLHVNWPKENWNWFIQYFKEFRKLMK